MLLQKFPKTVSYTVIMAVIPKINENSASGGGGMRSVLAPGGISHSGPGENRQFWPDENSQS